MKKKLIALSSLGLSAMPFLALAQPQQTGTFTGCAGIPLGTVEGVVCKIGDILNLVVPVLLVLGVIYFVWGVIAYVIASDEEAKTTGRNRMLFGIIGLFVIVSVWGLVRLLGNTFGLNSGSETITYPTVPY